MNQEQSCVIFIANKKDYFFGQWLHWAFLQFLASSQFSSKKIEILKMRAKFKSVWVRKLIGKLGVPYNRRLRVRGSPHPQTSCHRFINPSGGKQCLTRPFALCEAGSGNGLVYGF